MSGGADNPNGELQSYIIGANTRFLPFSAGASANLNIQTTVKQHRLTTG